MTVLLTGGAGYIGSHICVALLQQKQQVVLYDNFVNSQPEVVKHLAQITGQAIDYVRGDVRDQHLLIDTLRRYQCTAVIHCAGLKAVGDSVRDPLTYYDNNLYSTITLLHAMAATKVQTLVFSSSAAVYGEPQYLPIDEQHPLNPHSPYGRTKLFNEQIIQDSCQPDAGWRVAILRYFNPVGAHESGLIGENPRGVANNLLPAIGKVALRHNPAINIWGNDYATPDGTGIRDYLHVMDLAHGHVQALAYLQQQPYLLVNLGTGTGHSVLSMINTFSEISGQDIPYTMQAARAGDVAACYANPALAQSLLGWQTHATLAEMCASHWRWLQLNPNGYLEQ